MPLSTKDQALATKRRLSNPLSEVWELAVHTLGLPQGSFSRLFTRESLMVPYVLVKGFLGFQMPQTAQRG